MSAHKKSHSKEWWDLLNFTKREVATAKRAVDECDRLLKEIEVFATEREENEATKKAVVS